MTMPSILFVNTSEDEPDVRPPEPVYFADLALDQIVAAAIAGREEYDLWPFFAQPLDDLATIVYRQEVFRDLGDAALVEALQGFAAAMRTMRGHLALAERLSYPHQQERWFLEAVSTYGEAVLNLGAALSVTGRCTSQGLVRFAAYIGHYTASSRFTALRGQVQSLLHELASLRYCLQIEGLQVQCLPYQDQADYSDEIEDTFARFQEGAAETYGFTFQDVPEMNQVEARILDLVAELFPDLFAALAGFRAANSDFLDAGVARFDREMQVYLTWLEYTAPMTKAGLAFCLPLVTTTKEIYVDETVDLALAGRLVQAGIVPVANDFRLAGPERILVITGPNQGGKTTFARLFGQIHYLACLGLSVPGKRAQLFLFDHLFTHFEREEHLANLRGKLQDDLVRIHAILEQATPRSLLVINEMFASTTFQDALDLSQRIAARIMKLDLLCVWVTFIDELSMLGEQTVSMMSTVVADNPAQRTFKIVRQPADGRAHALTLAEQHRLTYDAIMERVKR